MISRDIILQVGDTIRRTDGPFKNNSRVLIGITIGEEHKQAKAHYGYEKLMCVTYDNGGWDLLETVYENYELIKSINPPKLISTNRLKYL